jgi:hypothetical protein
LYLCWLEFFWSLYVAVVCLVLHSQSSEGVKWTGVEWTGVDWTGVDWTGLDWRAREGGGESEADSGDRLEYLGGLLWRGSKHQARGGEYVAWVSELL